MKRLKLSKKGVLVGGFIPRPMHDSLNLLTLYHGTNKARLIQDFFFQLLKEAPPEEVMIKEIAQRIFEDWKKWYEVGDKKIPWSDYVEEVRATLNKKISIVYTDAVIEVLENLHREDKKTNGKRKQAQ